MKGLKEILAEMHANGRPANDQTMDEIISGLEAKKNYIPSSDRARRDYRYALLKEYRNYLKEHAGDGR